jgi:hypothetical protein
MKGLLTIQCPIGIQRRGRGAAKKRGAGAGGEPAASPVRLPRIARLMALALRFDGLVRTGAIADYADLARLGHVSRARISQIMNLLQLAPDIQEQLLFLGRTEQGRDPIHLARLQPIAALVDWKRQRRSWRELLRQTGG